TASRASPISARCWCSTSPSSGPTARRSSRLTIWSSSRTAAGASPAASCSPCLPNQPEVSPVAADPKKQLFPVSWQELHRDAKALAWRLNAGGPWRGIVAITRGGLVPAAIVARELGIRVIDTVSIHSYAHMTIGASNILKRPSSAFLDSKEPGRLLIV